MPAGPVVILHLIVPSVWMAAMELRRNAAALRLQHTLRAAILRPPTTNCHCPADVDDEDQRQPDSSFNHILVADDQNA